MFSYAFIVGWKTGLSSRTVLFDIKWASIAKKKQPTNQTNKYWIFVYESDLELNFCLVLFRLFLLWKKCACKSTFFLSVFQLTSIDERSKRITQNRTKTQTKFHRWWITETLFLTVTKYPNYNTPTNYNFTI